MERFEVRGCFSVEVEAENNLEAKDIAQRILQFDGIGFNIIDVQRRENDGKKTGEDSISGQGAESRGKRPAV